jgi:SAM-dependent methyltransferase
VTAEPRLPFDDRRFHFVCAASVFTHMAGGEDAWILEIRRVLKPGGLAYVTIHDERTAELLQALPGHWVTRKVVAALGEMPAAFDHFALGGPSPRDTIAFHGRAWLRERWGGWLEWVSATPEAYHYQTALLLRRRPD